MSKEKQNVDSNEDGTITNPDLQYHKSQDEDDEGNGSGDAVDEANDLRFDEEQQLIDEASSEGEARPDEG